MKILCIFITIWLIFCSTLWADLTVITSTTTLKSIVEKVGGDHVKVISIAKGPQDPHFIEAKPSYMVKVRKGDLFVSIGLDLEVGWINNVIRGSRNPKLQLGQLGHLQTGAYIVPMNIPSKVDRSQGDIHPLGNPHFYLDPIRIKKVIKAISERLSTLDKANEKYFISNSEKFRLEIDSEMKLWTERIKKTGVKGVVSYHRTLNYFLERFGLKFIGSLEAKPGIPPTPKHILSLIKTIKATHTKCILVESFFETSAHKRIKESVPVYFKTVATEVQALPEVVHYISLIENLVKAVEECGKFKGK